MGKIKLPDGFEKKIDKAISEMLDAFAEKMANDCDEKYKKIINDFYASYPHPRSYNRTRETRFATNYRDKNYKKIMTKIDSNTVQINYRISSEYINGHPYRADTDWVFRRTFEEGIHGWTPEEVMDYINGQNYGYYGNNGQFYINRMMYWHDVPEPFTPSPMERMDKWARQYKRPTNLRQILQPISKEILSKYL